MKMSAQEIGVEPQAGRGPDEAPATPLPDGDRPGWQARLDLGFAARTGADGAARTVLAVNRHTGPLRVQKGLHPEGPGVCHAVMLHPPAGIVGGDRLEIAVALGAASHAVLSTPGATPWYRSAGAFAHQQVDLRLADQARLDWLPQPSILYDGARADTCLHLDMAVGASAIGWEMTVLGRRGWHHPWADGRWRLRTTLAVEGRSLWLEQATLIAGSPLTTNRVGFAGLPVTGTLWAVGRAVHAGLAEALAARLPMEADLRAGVSCLGPVGEERPADPRDREAADAGERGGRPGSVGAGGPQAAAGAGGPGLLLVRALGREVEAVQSLFRSIWSDWRPIVHGVPAQPLRLWAT